MLALLKEITIKKIMFQWESEQCLNMNLCVEMHS